jgi:hypothetical protein
MAISSQTTTVSYTGNASTVTPYPVTFRYDEAAWVVVEEIDLDGVVTTLSLGTDYTLTGTGIATTGNVVTGGGAIPATSTLRISRNTALTQTVALAVNGVIPSATIEAEFDKLTMAQLDEKRRQAAGLARSLRVPDGELAAELPTSTLRKGEVIYFNATTGAVETKTPDEILALSGGAPDGIGIPAGGTTGQALLKTSGTDYAVQWDDVLTDIDVEGEIDAINRQPYSSKHISTWTGASAPSLRVAITGDSLAVLGPLFHGRFMARAGWIGGGYGTGAGSITTTTNDHAAWITGASMQFASGSSAEFSCGQAAPASIRGDRFVLYYLKKSGGGTFDLQYESADLPGTWVTFTVVTNGTDGNNVSAANATTIGAVFSATLPLSNAPAYKVRINDVTGGGVTVIAAGIYNSGGGGITWIPNLLAKGGLDFSSFVGVTPSAVYAPILADLAPHLILSCWADAGTNWDSGGAFRTYYSWFPAADWVQISANPASDESGHAAQRTSQRAWALEAGQTYINGHSMFGSYAAATALGFMADTVHLSTAGGVFRNHVLWAKLPIGHVYLGAIAGDAGYQPIQQSGQGAGVDDAPLRLSGNVYIEGAAGELDLMDQAAPLINARRARIYCSSSHLYLLTSGSTVSAIFPAGPSGFAGMSPPSAGYKLGGFGGFNWDANLRNVVTTGTVVYTPDTLSGAGAIPVTTPVTLFTSTGAAQALTLANGTAGQRKTIVHDVDGGSGILTPTTKTGFSTVTFTNAGDTVTLQYFTTRGWMVVGSYGVTIAP